MSAFLLTAGLVAEATGGQLVAGDPGRVFDAVSIDSRTMTLAPVSQGGAGTLFVALRGPVVDGHAFLPDVIAKGAAGVLVSEPPLVAGHAAVIVVTDPLEALQRLGQHVRRRSGARVVAITGSAGKTTTKEATATCLTPRFRVFCNAGNLNNHIGLPLSLLELRHGPEVAVVELGMNHAGEIRRLVELAVPDVRVWINVGNAHIGHLGTVEAVAAAKAEILEGAGAGTLVVANAGDPLVMRHVTGSTARVLTFGVDAGADVQATRIEDRGFDGIQADVHSPWGDLSLDLAVAGRPNLLNVLAAATVALDMGVAPEAVSRQAASLVAVHRRGEMRVLPRGVRLIDDSYNASPAAVIAMLSTLAKTSTSGRRVVVLGEMFELGDQSREWHAACGRAVADAGVDLLVVIGGPDADGAVDGARAAGFDQSHVWRFADSAAAAEPVASMVRADDVVLVKGSRGTRTDIVADRLKAAG